MFPHPQSSSQRPRDSSPPFSPSATDIPHEWSPPQGPPYVRPRSSIERSLAEQENPALLRQELTREKLELLNLDLREKFCSTSSEDSSNSPDDEVKAVSCLTHLPPISSSQPQTASEQDWWDTYDTHKPYRPFSNQPWSHLWIVNMVRGLLPGEMPAFLAKNGEIAPPPGRQQPSEERKAEIKERRRIGACEECRRRKKACYHTPDKAAFNPRDDLNKIDIEDQIDVQDQIFQRASKSSRSPAAEQEDLHGHTSQPLLQHQETGVVESSETSGILSFKAPRYGHTLSQVLDRFDSDSVTGHGSSYAIEAALNTEIQQSTAYPDPVYHGEKTQSMILEEDQHLDRPAHKDTDEDIDGELSTNPQHERDQVDTMNLVLADSYLNLMIENPELFGNDSPLGEHDVLNLDRASILRDIDALLDGTDSNSDSFFTPSTGNT